MNTPIRRPRRRGFMLGNILFVLILLAAFTLAATRVFRLSILSTQSAAKDQERSLRLEQAMRTLRADVWQAASIQAVEPGQLRLTNSNSPVEWRTDAEGNLTRTAGQDSQTWNTLHVSFTHQGPTILLKEKEKTVAALEQGVAR
jgi:Tfp pilus assembly protein PilX